MWLQDDCDVPDVVAAGTIGQVRPPVLEGNYRRRGPPCRCAVVCEESNSVYMLLKPILCSYRRILSRFSNAIQSPDEDSADSAATATPLAHKIPILGFSATFSRHDGLALGSVFEQIVYHQDFLQMIKDQWYVEILNVWKDAIHVDVPFCVGCAMSASHL